MITDDGRLAPGGALRLNDLAVGRDGRNRLMLSAFQARTGRNQPSNSRFIFGPSVWLRGLIKPPPGYGVAYIDWRQQEFAVAAVLSNDVAMQAAYQSGDPYLTFGQQAGLIPADGTKTSHKFERELCKQCVLATQYGMEAESLSARIGRCARYRNVNQFITHCVWLAHPCRREPKSEITAQFRRTGQRRRNDAHRRLPCYRTRRRSLCAGTRRLSNLRAT